MSRPRLVQVLCGPDRHCIMALPYEPGLTAAAELILTEKNAELYVRGCLDNLVTEGRMNPWCGLCGRRQADWHYEDRELGFDTLAEALPYLLESARQQAAVRGIIRSKN